MKMPRTQASASNICLACPMINVYLKNSQETRDTQDEEMALTALYTQAYTALENELVNKSLQQWTSVLEKSPGTIHLPPGMSSGLWPSILAEFEDVVGKEHVVTADELRAQFSDPFAFVLEEQNNTTASAALQPKSVEEIQGVLKIANKHKIPLWTISRGRNLGYGGPAPRVKGSVIVDLSRMNKIIEVNDRYFYYVVEPGVSFYELYEYIREHKKAVWPSIPALGWGSVVGNALERGWGYTPTGDHSNNICGMEVVLADGTVIRTGSGALKDSPCWHLFKGGYGPAYDSIFSQSNLGIVTRLGLWATPAPEGFMACHIDVPLETDLVPLVDTFSGLLLREVIQNHPVIGNVPRAISMRGPRKNFYDGQGAIPDKRLLELQHEFGIGFWDARFGLYGPKDTIEANYRRCQEAFAKIEGATLEGHSYYPKCGAEYVDAADILPQHGGGQIGVPSMMAITSLQYRGDDGGHIGFSPVLPPDGKSALDFYYTSKATCAKHGFDFYSGLHLYPRHLVHINMLLFDRQSPEQLSNVHELFIELVGKARDAGYSEYRAHVGYMDLVATQYDFGDCALRKFSERVKDCLDPNGILSPGKQGIWPETFRGERQPVGTDFAACRSSERWGSHRQNNQ